MISIIFPYTKTRLLRTALGGLVVYTFLLLSAVVHFIIIWIPATVFAEVPHRMVIIPFRRSNFPSLSAYVVHIYMPLGMSVVFNINEIGESNNLHLICLRSLFEDI